MSKYLNSLNSACILSAMLCLLPFVGGCTRTMPATKRLHDSVLNGKQDPKQFQYYISRPITLVKRDTSGDFEIVGGKIKLYTGKTDTLHFKRNTPGVLVQTRNTSPDGKQERLRYEIRFGDDPNSCLTFGESSDKRRRGLYLCYSEPRKSIVTYGGAEYYVETPSGNPWLIIKDAGGKKQKKTVSGANI